MVLIHFYYRRATEAGYGKRGDELFSILSLLLFSSYLAFELMPYPQSLNTVLIWQYNSRSFPALLC